MAKIIDFLQFSHYLNHLFPYLKFVIGSHLFKNSHNDSIGFDFFIWFESTSQKDDKF